LVDVVFTAATDVEVVPPSPDTEVPVAESGPKSSYEFTDSALLQEKRVSIIDTLAQREGTHLLQKSRAQYWNANRDVRAVCSISKRYTGKNQNPYWYAYHPQWDEFLAGGKQAFFVLGCMDLGEAFAVPRDAIQSILPKLHQTIRETGAYWHVHLTDTADGLAIIIPNSPTPFSLKPFRLKLA